MWAIELVVAKLAFQQQNSVLSVSTIRAVGVCLVAILYNITCEKTHEL